MFKKNTAVTGFGIGHFINATTGATVTTGTPTCKRTLDGTGGACANAASYNTDGAVWEIDLDAADMNGDVVVLSFTLTDCLPIAYTIRTSTKLVSELNDYAGGDTSGTTTLLTRLSEARAGALTDWVDGGRLDLLLDAIKAKTDLGLLNTTWTDAKAGYLDATITSRHASGAAVAKSPATLDWSADVSNKPTIGTSTFDPATDTVANVTTVGTVTNAVTTDVASREASKATGFAVPGSAMSLTVAERTSVGAAVLAAMQTAGTYLARLFGLIENSSGDRFTEKALEAAPTSSGELTPPEIYDYFIAENRANAFKATGFSVLSTADIDARLANWGKTGFALHATTGWGGAALPTIPTPPAPSAIAAEVYASGRVFPATNLVNAPGGGTSTITVLPYTGTAAGTGELSSHQLVAYQHSAATFALGVYDADGDPVDLSGRNLAWVAYDPNDPTTAVLTVRNYDGETAIVITGESSNTAQVSLSALDMAPAANWAWILRDATNDLALMVGKLRIIAVPAIPAIPVAPE